MFEDEFEEFRARSYSGGFSTRCRRRTHHRSRTTDHLTEYPSDIAFSSTLTHSPTIDAPQTAPIHWGSNAGPFLRQRQETNVKRNRNGVSSRLLEVSVIRKKEDWNGGSWNIGEIRPRLNSAPQKRACHCPNRRHVLGGDGPPSERRSPDITLSYPIRKIRSFIVLGKKCLHGDEDLGAVALYKDHGSSNDHRFFGASSEQRNDNRSWKDSDDFRSHKPTNPFWALRELENFRPDMRKSPVEQRPPLPEETYRVLFTGRRGVGKSTIMERLQRKDGLDCSKALYTDYEEVPGCCLKQKGPPLVFDGDGATVVLNDLTTNETSDAMLDDDVTAVVIVYSVEDRKSYELAVDRLYDLCSYGAGRQMAVILVANKVDLVRTRVISEQEGKSTAKTYDCKYIEVSAAIDHQIDDLFFGLLRQLRLVSAKLRQQSLQKRGFISPTRHAKRWTQLDRGESLDHRQNSDTCCLLAAREKVLAKLFNGQRRASRSCINLFEL